MFIPLTLLAIVIFIIAVIVLFVSSDSNGSGFMFALIGIFVALIIGVASCGVFVINAGEVGVTNVWGTVGENPLQAGLHLVIPFVTDIISFDIKTQVDTQQSLVLTAEGLPVVCDMSLQYRLDPQKVPNLYKTVGMNYKEVVIDPEVRSAVRDVIATYDAKNIYSSDRTNISTQVQKRLEGPLTSRGVIVESVLLRSTDLPQKIKDAIESKQQAEQAIQQKEFEVEKERMEAQRKVAEAQGIADANRIISNSITPEYIKWYTVEMMQKRTGDTYYIPIGSDGLPMIGNFQMSHQSTPSAAPAQ